MTSIGELLQLAPVIPVLTIERREDARPIAEALVAGGLRVLEVTLRTDAAFDAIREMASVSGAIVGAGTVRTPDDLSRSIDAGAEFAVSPGLTTRLHEAADREGIPFLPGVATPTEIMIGMERGLGYFKFFPAEASGGVDALKALTGPFPDARFCPTGGVNMETAQQWLDLEAVVCVGGSWVVPSSTDYRVDGIERLASAAADLRRAGSFEQLG